MIMSMTLADEKEILEIEKLKADYRKVIQDLDKTPLELEKLKAEYRKVIHNLGKTPIELEKLKAEYRKVIQDLDVTPKLYYLKLYGALTATIALSLAAGKFLL